MPYAGKPLEDVAVAKKVIYETLEQQPGGAAPLEIEVTEEKFRIVQTRFNPIVGVRAAGVAVYFAKIADVLLSVKRGLYTVTILGPNGDSLVHVRISDQRSAERFIDALQTMRQASTLAARPS